MARKRNPKQTEQAPVTVEELPRDTEALSSEEAEAAKGGISDLWKSLTPTQQRAAKSGDLGIFPEGTLSPNKTASLPPSQRPQGRPQ